MVDRNDLLAWYLSDPSAVPDGPGVGYAMTAEDRGPGVPGSGIHPIVNGVLMPAIHSGAALSEEEAADYRSQFPDLGYDPALLAQAMSTQGMTLPQRLAAILGEAGDTMASPSGAEAPTSPEMTASDIQLMMETQSPTQREAFLERAGPMTAQGRVRRITPGADAEAALANPAAFLNAPVPGVPSPHADVYRAQGGDIELPQITPAPEDIGAVPQRTSALYDPMTGGITSTPLARIEAGIRYGSDETGSPIAFLESGQELRVPEGADPEAWLYQAGQNSLRAGGEELNIDDPLNPMIPPAIAADMIHRYRQARAGMSQRAAGAGPRAMMRVDQTIPGPVDPALLERARQLGIAVPEAQEAALAGMREAAEQTQAAMEEFAQQQQLAAQQQQAQAADHQERLMMDLQRFQQAAEDVANRRVDPDQYFGGFGGRMGAALAVALGELGKGFSGGGENAALNIINQAIDRNIRSQEFNIEGARRGVQMQGQALAQMQSIFQNREAADSAARSLHLQAMQSQLQALMAGLTGEQQANAQALANLLGEQAQVAAQIAAQREAGSQERRLQVSGTPGQVAGAMARIQGQPGAAPRRGAGGRGTRQAPPRRAGFEAPDEGLERFFRVGALAGTGLQLQRTADGQPDPRAEERFNAMQQDDAERREFNRVAADLNFLTNTVPILLASAREYTAEIVDDADLRTAFAERFATQIRNIRRQQFTGVAFSEEEQAEYKAFWPSPTEVTGDNLFEIFDQVQNAWQAATELAVREANARLNQWGLQFRGTGVFNSPQSRRTAETARAPGGLRGRPRAESSSGRALNPEWMRRNAPPDFMDLLLGAATFGGSLGD